MCKGKFIGRPNRFIAEVEIDGRTVRAHVKNTGRCQELLVPGTEVWLEDFAERMGNRKLRYALIGVQKGMEKLVKVQREKTFGRSRFDFYVEDIHCRGGWLEVKGVTLEEDGVARFPDAPTERGVKHVLELTQAAAQGYQAYVLFVIQMKGVSRFEPNDRTHRAFGDALRQARAKGVCIMARDCQVWTDGMTLDEAIPVYL